MIRALSNDKERAKATLRLRVEGVTDDKGYVSAPEQNLLPGIDFAAVAPDLMRGDGDELASKFRAVHSSSALAVNSFGPFKAQPERLLLLGEQGATAVEFERAFRVFRGGTAPNLDVWVDRGTSAVAIESKCLEYFTRKPASFSPAYEKLAPPRSEACWWRAYEQAKRGEPQHLDCAQLLKHYFGLCAFMERHPNVTVTLLYLFWEPLNWCDVEACVRHRQELARFSETVSNARLPFHWLTYNELWDAWAEMPGLADHVRRLKARYQVEL